MNELINLQLNHRSIRKFKDKAVEPDKLETILQAFVQAPTSSNMQVSSLIHVKDQQIKDGISEVANQPYIKNVPEVFVAIVDLRRNYLLAKEHGYEGDGPGMNLFFQGVADAYIQLQNASLAIESMGLGSVFLGSVMNDPQKMIDLLALPQYTFPMVGLAFGYPDENPELKPRMPCDKRYFEDNYQTYDSYADEIAGYDETLSEYYNSRSTNNRTDTFSDQVLRKFNNKQVKRDQLLQVAEKQGFDLGL